MQIVSQLVFAVVLGVAVYIFYRQVSKVRRNILLGKAEDRNDRKKERLSTMLRVAFGQTKMVRRPIPALLHFFVYIGFILINIEILEIIIDGLAGTHRIFMEPLGVVYNIAIGFFEILGVLVLVSCVIFLIRRFALKVPRLNMAELKGWPMKDAANILIIEIVLMAALLVMNAADRPFQEAANMPISSLIAPLFSGMNDSNLHTVERVAWWAHIIGVLAFLNYLPFSKHWHIIMAFPNTYYSNLEPKGEFPNPPEITTEVKLAMDFSATPPEGYQPPTSFGVKDVTDLGWKNLMDAYSCTECGRCTAVCPANITGKKLSPRKIM
ncbi:MAG TPA: Fe-S oxidoreductase, partial [Bacteroidia bacterium]|nr:Fe-S oxidoreductase [Bacteroidia bacterium]